MQRRRFLKLTSISALSLAAPLPSHAAGPQARPTRDQRAWQDLEVGLFVHIAPNTWQDLESDDLSTPLSRINPAHLDTDQWARSALSIGARYLVFVAKHQGGFCMWQTQTTSYGIRNTPWKDGHGDVLAEVAASCKKFGLRLGVYLCPRDDHFGATTGGVCATPELQARYDILYRQQLTEVLSRYGPMVEVWFDGSVRTPVADILQQYQPHAVIFQGAAATIRWVGNEDGYAPYPCWNGISAEDAHAGTATALNGDPNGAVWLPNEVDVSIRRPDWFWSTGNEPKVLTVDQLVSIYYRSVGRGAQLLLNIPANREGLLPEPDCSHAKQFGAEIERRFHTPAAITTGRGTLITLSLRQQAIDTVILQEDLSGGERVRRFQIEGRKRLRASQPENKADTRWHIVGTGSAIGHKRILPISPDRYDSLRLRVLESVGVPRLRSFAAFHTVTAPPADWNEPTHIWSADLVGGWKDSRFHLDLTKTILAAAQYRLRFVALADAPVLIKSITLTLHGVRQNLLLKPEPQHPDAVLLDMTEIGGEVIVEGRIEGADEGSILLQKL